MNYDVNGIINKRKFTNNFIRRKLFRSLTKIKNISFILFVTLVISIAMNLNSSTAASTMLQLSPNVASVPSTEVIEISVSVQNIVNLSAWQIKLTFNPHVLKFVNITVPSDNVFSGYDTTGLGTKIDNVSGFVLAFNAIWGNIGVNGSGVLCKIEFQALNPGITYLLFANEMQIGGTYLMDSGNQMIPFQSSYGKITVVSDNFQEQIFNVTAGTNETSIILYSNSSITNFNFNYLMQEFSFSADGIEGTVGTCEVLIPSSTMKRPLIVLINQTSIKYSSFFNDSKYDYLIFSYYHKAQVRILSTIIGDITGDREVDMRDISIAAYAFGATPKNPRWDPRADINGDEVINMRDIAVIARNFGETWNP